MKIIFIPKGTWGGAQVVTFSLFKLHSYKKIDEPLKLVTLTSGRLVEDVRALGYSVDVISGGRWPAPLREALQFGRLVVYLWRQRANEIILNSNYSLLVAPCLLLLGRAFSFINHGRPYHRNALVYGACMAALYIVESTARASIVVNPLVAVSRRAIALPNFISEKALPETERATERACEGRSRRILIIAEYTRNKGVDHLLGIMSAVRFRFPDAEALVVGRRNNLDAAAEGAFNERGVFFHGECRDIRSLIRGAWCVVSVSRNESFGLGSLLAVKMGCPVLATSTDGARYLSRFCRGLLIFKSTSELVEQLSALDDVRRLVAVRHIAMLERIWEHRACWFLLRA
jgi:glycosyltransferase involved in cell wall biosynthesis